MHERRQQGTAAALAIAGAALIAGGAPAAALAVPPANDHYLASTVMQTPTGGFPADWSATVDTTEATTQGDLFQPDRDGAPLGGGQPEPLLCGNQLVGKTVWFDFTPPVDGGVEVSAQGFDTSVAVFRYDAKSSSIDKLIGCSATPGTGESFVVPHRVLAGRSYTVQVGGAVVGGVPASGLLSFGFQFFGDRDGDGILDAQPDRCPDLPGIDDFGGCPPPLKPSVSVNYRRSGSGVRLTSLVLAKVPKHAAIRVRAGGRTVKARGTGRSIRLNRLRGVLIRSGTSLSVRVTLKAQRKGKYKHGAVGSYYTYKVRSGRVGTRKERCLVPGSSKPRKRCRKP